MTKKVDNTERDERIDEILEKHRKLDDICIEILFTLQAYKRLRFNELHRRLKMFGTDISKPTLIEHLKHLQDQKLISRKQEDFQNVSYGLTDEIVSLLTVPEEEIRERIERFIDDKDLPKHLRRIKIDAKQVEGDLWNISYEERFDPNSIEKEEIENTITLMSKVLPLDYNEEKGSFSFKLQNPICWVVLIIC